MADSPVCFTIIFNIIDYNPNPHMVVPFFWLLYIDKHNVKWGRQKGDRRKLRNFKCKGKQKIRCYPKYLLIITAYHVQGWWTMILSPVKFHPDGSNVRTFLIKILCHTHVKHSTPYAFILQKVKNTPDGLLSSPLCLINHPNTWLHIFT